MPTPQYGVDKDRVNSRVALNYAGTRFLSGTASGATFPLATTFEGAMTGARMNPIITAADTLLLTVAQSGSLILATKGSATQVFTLPAASNAGLVYTFKCADAAGEINIDPDGTDDMQVKATNDAGANIVETDGTGIQNTAGTNVLGDYVTLVSDGVVKWYTVAQSGIWATQG